MLVLGDSTALFGGHGFDAGLIKAGAAEFGLAGSGLFNATTSGGEGHASFVFTDQGFTKVSAADVTGPGMGYAWDTAAVAGSSNATRYTARVDAGPLLDIKDAYTWNVYAAANSADARTGAYRRLGGSPYTTLQTLSNQSIAGVQRVSFDFAAQPDATIAQEFVLRNTRDTTVLYNRLQTQANEGITVTTWGYGGKSTLDFYNDKLLSMSDAGRSAFLDATVDGGSGKLNIVLIQGFNDRNETDASLGGTVDGDSPQAFAENIAGSIDLLRDDWVRAGRSVDDLSFTLLGMYDIANGNDELRDYAGVLESMAASDPQLSFVDFTDITPSYDDANALGYFADGIHLSRTGSDVYSKALMDAIVAIPEPGSMLVVSGIGLLLCRRRRA